MTTVYLVESLNNKIGEDDVHAAHAAYYAKAFTTFDLACDTIKNTYSRVGKVRIYPADKPGWFICHVTESSCPPETVATISQIVVYDRTDHM